MKKRILSTLMVLVLVLTAAAVPAAAAGCPVNVNYNLCGRGVSQDQLSESVASDSKPAHVPRVRPIEEGVTLLGWSRTDPAATPHGQLQLVDPTADRVQEDTVFYAVYSDPRHNHYVIGYPGGTFGPNDPITRASVATIIARAILPEFVEGADYGNPGFYLDVRGHWAESAIAFCTKFQVFEGYDGRFRPDDPITRQEFALVVARLLDEIKENQGTPFSDESDVDGWAINGVYTAYAEGWINGYPDGTFKPKSDISRAEAVKIFNAYLKRGVDKNGLNDLHAYVQGSAEGVNAAEHNDLYMTWPDVPETYWAYYEIMEAANDHQFFFVSGQQPPEHWTSSWIQERWLYYQLEAEDEDETTPAEEETAPAEGETTPTEGETTPAEGATP